MSKMKKVLLMCTAYVLVAALAIGGTVAYLQDSDSDVNVMTLGNVKIEQHEYEREVDADGNYVTDTIDNVTSYVLKDFTQGKPLLPIVGDPNEPSDSPAYAGYDATRVRMTQVDSYGTMDVFAGKNAQDKFVTVENTGKTDAYVRTLVAIENGTGDASLIGIGSRCVPAADADTNTAPWVSNYIGKITVDGNTYGLYEYVYRGASDVNRHVNGILPAGDTTYPSLCQVYLKHNATNEDMVKIDGNGNGTLDILVISQAVQTAGFADAQTALDTAFGKASEKAAEWFGSEKMPTLVSTVDELQDAIDSAENGSVITLTEDIAGSITAPQKQGVTVTIDGNGKDFSGSLLVDGKSGTYTTAGLVIKNVVFNADSLPAGVDACIQLGNGNNNTRYTCNVTIENCVFDVPDAVGVKSYTGGDKNLTILNCTATARAHSLAQLKGIDGILVKDCTVNSVRGINFNNSDNIVVENCTIDVQKYAVRFGESANTTVENYAIIDSTIASDNVEGDAAIVLRAGATNANLTLTNTTITAGTEMSGHDNANIVIN